MLNIRIEKTKNPKEKPHQEKLSFGKIFTDHMFVMNYTEGKGWYDPRIVPYQNLSLAPSAMVFHYGQEMFVDRDCIPKQPGTSLYIRPFIIATDEFLGVAPSQNYLFIVILSPSGAYYENGLEPVGIWIEDEYVRAVRGGMGFAKTGGNYAASLIAQVKAHDDGYSQVLWLDGVERKYIEEVGAMNIFFKIDGKIVTPMLNGSILPGITRDSVIHLCKSWGLPVEERKVSVDELLEAHKNGTLEEVFGTGTAAVISPVGKLRYENDVKVIGDGKIGEISQKLYDTVTGIQLGKLEDKFGWRFEV